MKKILIALIFWAASLNLTAQSYHVGVGFSPYAPPLSGVLEIGSMATNNLYFGGQFFYRATNAPTFAGGILAGFFHHWNNNANHDLSTGVYIKTEKSLYIHNNDEFKNATKSFGFGYGVRHYIMDWTYLDFGRCQYQWTFTIGVKFGSPIYR